MPWFRLCHDGAIDVSKFGNECMWVEATAQYVIEVVTEMRGNFWAKTKRILRLFEVSVEEASEAGEGGNSYRDLWN